MPSMRVSLPGLFANIVRGLPRQEQPQYKFALDEVLTHLRETIAGEHTLDEFAEHYCLKDRDGAAAPAHRNPFLHTDRCPSHDGDDCNCGAQ